MLPSRGGPGKGRAIDFGGSPLPAPALPGEVGPGSSAVLVGFWGVSTVAAAAAAGYSRATVACFVRWGRTDQASISNSAVYL